MEKTPSNKTQSNNNNLKTMLEAHQLKYYEKIRNK